MGICLYDLLYFNNLKRLSFHHKILDYDIEFFNQVNSQSCTKKVLGLWKMFLFFSNFCLVNMSNSAWSHNNVPQFLTLPPFWMWNVSLSPLTSFQPYPVVSILSCPVNFFIQTWSKAYPPSSLFPIVSHWCILKTHILLLTSFLKILLKYFVAKLFLGFFLVKSID